MLLNKNGWGLREMIIYCGILLVFLFIAVFMIYRLYHGLSSRFSNGDNGNINNPTDNPSRTYGDLEKIVKDGALMYAADYYNLEGDALVITLENLINNNYIEEEVKDIKDNSVCKGYALIRKEDEGFVGSSYIKCKNYTTNGYQDWRIE